MGTPLVPSGLDLLATPLECEVLSAPPPPALRDPLAAMRAALERPLVGPPLAARVGARSRVLVVLEPPDHLVPRGRVNPLRLGARAILDVLRGQGVRHRNVKFLVANGLEHRPSMAELARVLGLEVTGAYDVSAFDAEAHRAHRPFPGNPELAAQLAEADLVIDLSVRAHGSRPVLGNLVEGLATYASVRALHAPGSDGTTLAQQLGTRARALAQALPIFSLAIVVNEAVFAPRVRGLVEVSARAWSRLPAAIRRRMAASFRSAAAPFAVLAGDPLTAEARAEELAAASVRVRDGEALDALVIGVPELAPDSPHARSNPVLVAHLGLVKLLVRARHRLRPGGAVILANPLEERVERPLHLPYADFYERALRVARSGEELAARFEIELSGRPELVAAYRKKGAVHGAQPFHRWYELERARQGLHVFAAGAGASAAQRVGLQPATSIDDALAQAREALGVARPRVGLLDLPGIH